jgi:hypothetical protein
MRITIDIPDGAYCDDELADIPECKFLSPSVELDQCMHCGLKNQDLEVIFNEERDSSYTVKGSKCPAKLLVRTLI